MCCPACSSSRWAAWAQLGTEGCSQLCLEPTLPLPRWLDAEADPGAGAGQRLLLLLGQQQGWGGAEELQCGGPGYVTARFSQAPTHPSSQPGSLWGWTRYRQEGQTKPCLLCLISSLFSEAAIELSRNSQNQPKMKGGKDFRYHPTAFL